MSGPAVAVGDKLTFRAVTRWDNRAVTRVIRAIAPDGKPMVAYGGWHNFIVLPDEILAIAHFD